MHSSSRYRPRIGNTALGSFTCHTHPYGLWRYHRLLKSVILVHDGLHHEHRPQISTWQLVASRDHGHQHGLQKNILWTLLLMQLGSAFWGRVCPSSRLLNTTLLAPLSNNSLPNPLQLCSHTCHLHHSIPLSAAASLLHSAIFFHLPIAFSHQSVIATCSV